MAKFEIGTLIFLIVALYLGGFLAGFIIPYFGAIAVTTGWILGILTGIIQMLVIILLLGSTGKLSIWTLTIGGLIIFIGGIFGGFIADFVPVTGLVATLLILVVQSAALIMTGVVSSKGTVQTKTGI